MFLIFNHKHDFFFSNMVISIRVRNFPPFSNYSPPFSRRKAHYNFCQHRGLKIGGAGSCKTERKALFSVFTEKKGKIKLKEHFIVLIILINWWHFETEFLAVIKPVSLFKLHFHLFWCSVNFFTLSDFKFIPNFILSVIHCHLVFFLMVPIFPNVSDTLGVF